MPEPCNGLGRSMPPCSRPGSGRPPSRLFTTKRTGEMSHQNPPHPRWGRSGCLFPGEHGASPSFWVPEKGDRGLLCSLQVALAATGQGQERQNGHLYICCNKISDSTRRIVPTLSTRIETSVACRGFHSLSTAGNPLHEENTFE